MSEVAPGQMFAFGQKCVIEELGNICNAGAQPPEEPQLCYFKPDPDNPYGICGVKGTVTDGVPTMTSGGEYYCRQAGGGARGEAVTAAERQDPKYDLGFNLGAVFELTKPGPPAGEASPPKRDPKYDQGHNLRAMCGDKVADEVLNSPPPESTLKSLGKVIKNVLRRPGSSK